jgi:hypothetical protein
VSGRIRTDCALWALSAAVQLLHEIGVKPAEVEATYCLHTNKYGARWGAGWSADGCTGCAVSQAGRCGPSVDECGPWAARTGRSDQRLSRMESVAAADQCSLLATIATSATHTLALTGDRRVRRKLHGTRCMAQYGWVEGLNGGAVWLARIAARRV